MGSFRFERVELPGSPSFSMRTGSIDSRIKSEIARFQKKVAEGLDALLEPPKVPENASTPPARRVFLFCVRDNIGNKEFRHVTNVPTT